MINHVTLQGRLTADAELKSTSSGIFISEFTVAWSEKYKETETKCFLRCKAWRKTAEFVSRHFSKGQQIAVEGKLITESWEKDGKQQSRTILTVEQIHFCGDKVKSEAAAQNDITYSADELEDFEIIDGDVPF